jgi:hypothetical protein
MGVERVDVLDLWLRGPRRLSPARRRDVIAGRPAEAHDLLPAAPHESRHPRASDERGCVLETIARIDFPAHQVRRTAAESFIFLMAAAGLAVDEIIHGMTAMPRPNCHKTLDKCLWSKLQRDGQDGRNRHLRRARRRWRDGNAGHMRDRCAHGTEHEPGQQHCAVNRRPRNE